MKITIATGPIFPVPAVRGGAVQRLWEGLAREFAQRGHEVTIFAREFPGQAAEETVNGIRFVRRGGYAQSTSIKRDLVQCLLYALKTARYVPPGDVVVTNDFWMPAVLPWLKPSAGRIVVNANRFPKKQYWLYPKCAAFAAVSAPVAEAVKAQTPSAADRVAVVPNAIDYAFLKETQSRGDRRRGTKDGETKRPRDEKTKRLKDQGSKGQPEVGDRRSEPRLGELAPRQTGDRLHGNQLILDDGTMGQEPEAGRPEMGRRGDQTGDRGQETGVGGPPTHGVTTAGQAYGMRHTAEGRRVVRILYVGRIHPEKGLGLLAQALKSMEYGAGSMEQREGTGDRGQATGSRRQETDWECVLVGPVKESEGGGGEAFAEELKRQVEGLPVRFEAPVYDPAALAKIYDEADVFVYPSVAETGESFGIAPLEAMARGVVPVVSDLAVFREYLEPGVHGLVFDHRSDRAAENLAASLRELLGDAEGRERMGAAARQTAERFSSTAIADKYLQLFEKVVSGT